MVSTLSKLFSPLFEHQIDPLNEIVTSIGGYGALFNCFQAFVEPGDEVSFDYLNTLKLDWMT